MITLNLDTDSPLISVQSIDDITSLPGFRTKLDPIAENHKLKSVIGAYQLQQEVNCGLPCNQPHLRGYVVKTDKGAIIVLGQVCGNRHFGIDFRTSRARFVREATAKERRGTVTRYKAQIPILRERLKELRASGAHRFYQLGNQLQGEGGLVPQAMFTVIQNLMRTGRNVLVTRRAASSEDLDLYYAANGRKAPPDYSIEEEAGRIDGLSFFAPGMDLRELITRGIEATLDRLQTASPETTRPIDLNKLAKACGRLDDQFRMAEASIEAARRLFAKSNLQTLLKANVSNSDRKRFREFLNTLPAAS